MEADREAAPHPWAPRGSVCPYKLDPPRTHGSERGSGKRRPGTGLPDARPESKGRALVDPGTEDLEGALLRSTGRHTLLQPAHDQRSRPGCPGTQRPAASGECQGSSGSWRSDRHERDRDAAGGRLPDPGRARRLHPDAARRRDLRSVLLERRAVRVLRRCELVRRTRRRGQRAVLLQHRQPHHGSCPVDRRVVLHPGAGPWPTRGLPGDRSRSAQHRPHWHRGRDARTG